MPGERAPTDIIDYIKRVGADLEALKLNLTRRTTYERYTPAFKNNWANYNPSWRPLTLFKSGGMVTCMGTIAHPSRTITGAGWDDRSICDIPPGWRPAYFDLYHGRADQGLQRIDVEIGVFDLFYQGTPSVAIGWMNISGFIWPAEQ
jgi:hypothetical protein